jgi:hypothetical protein
MFKVQKIVPEILRLSVKTELKLVEALLRKSKNSLSVSKKTSKQTSKQVNQQEISITRHRRDFGFFAIDPCRSIEELIRFWAW